MKPPGMIPRRIGFVAALQCSRGSMNSPPPAAKLARPERFEICKAGWLDSRGLFAPPLDLHFSPFFDPDQGRMIFVVDRQLNVSRDVYLQIEKNVSRDLSLAFHCF